jgi:hypothetical protein
LRKVLKQKCLRSEKVGIRKAQSQKALDQKGMESKMFRIRNVWIGSDSVIDTAESIINTCKGSHFI